MYRKMKEMLRKKRTRPDTRSISSCLWTGRDSDAGGQGYNEEGGIMRKGGGCIVTVQGP